MPQLLPLVRSPRYTTRDLELTVPHGTNRMMILHRVLFLVLGLSTAAAADQSVPPKLDTDTVVHPRTRWSAAIDRKALCGHWRLSEQAIGFSKPEEQIIGALTSVNAELKIDANGFRVVGTAVSGKLSNEMNQIEFLPEKFWLNTAEPRLRLSLSDGTKAELSYVVENDRVSFRYPANSCSRSGVRFSFVRVGQNPTQ